MKQLFTLVTIFSLGLLSINDAQAQRWNRYKMELGVSLGTTALMGDLGGGPEEASRFGDYQIKSSSYAFGGFFKYRFHERFAVKFNLLYGQFTADDAKTENAGRQSRNLNVRTNLTELSGQLEFYLFKENIGKGYKLKGIKGYGGSNFSMYLFAGIGASYFSPTGQTEAGDWVKLAPLNTEGQTLPGGPADYSQITIVFPSGVGFKYNINNAIGIQFEAGVRLTTTDYLDDVSNTYYDGDMLAQYFGDLSKEMADKRYGNPKRHEEGGIRGGNKYKDAYAFGLLTLTYRLKSKARSRIRL